MDPNLDIRQWFVLQTKPRQESRVIRHLDRRAPDVSTFFPKIEVLSKRNGSRVARLEPLFPNYLFLHMVPAPPIWNVVQWTWGAHKLLGDRDGPVPVPDEFMDTVRARVAELGFARVDQSFRPGSEVRVRAGSFAGFEGIFERPTSRKDRVRILLSVLGAVRPLTIDPLDLEAI